MEPNPILDQICLKNAVERCREHGFTHRTGWLFEKDGVTYDLSAADLDQLDRIERDRLFVSMAEASL